MYFVLCEDGEEVAVHYSGNPGYVVGLPLVSGTRTAEYPLPALILDFPLLDSYHVMVLCLITI